MVAYNYRLKTHESLFKELKGGWRCSAMVESCPADTRPRVDPQLRRNWVWWHMPAIPALERWRQGDEKSKVIFGSPESRAGLGYMRHPDLQKEKENDLMNG